MNVRSVSALGTALLCLSLGCGGEDSSPGDGEFLEEVAGRWWGENPNADCDKGFYYFTNDGRLLHEKVFTTFPNQTCDDCQGGTDYWEQTEDGFIAVFGSSSAPGPPRDVWSWRILDLGSGGKQLDLYDEGEGGSLDYTLFLVDELPVDFRAQCCDSGECP